MSAATGTQGRGPPEASTLGMWVFLASEVLFFGGLILAYAVYRVAYPDTFGAASDHLDRLIGGLNTAILLTSSLTMALADRSAELGARGRARLQLVAAALLGLVFLAIKLYEWQIEAAKKLAPIGSRAFDYPGEAERHAEMFFNLYFAMTGVHALHLLVAVGVVLVLAARPSAPVSQVRGTGLFWHFVDLVWIFLYPILYLVR